MRTRRIAAVLVTAVVTASGAVSCAIDHSKPDTAKKTVRIAYQNLLSGDLIVKNNKWLEQALPDYNIKWTKFDSGADVNTAFIAKQADFGTLGSSPLARGLSDPLNIGYSVAFILDVAGDNEALVARNGSDVTTIVDLKGKRVATPFASTAHYSLLAALAQNGLSPSDVQLIDLQPQAILAAWERGDIAAAYTWLPTLEQLEKSGRILITSRELADKGKPTMDLAAVSTSFAKENPGVVDVWRQQEARALNAIKNDPDSAAKAIAAEVSLSADDVARQLSKAVFLTPEQVASPEWLGTEGKPGNVAANLQIASQFLADQKQIPAAAPLTIFQSAIYTTGLPNVITK